MSQSNALAAIIELLKMKGLDTKPEEGEQLPFQLDIGALGEMTGFNTIDTIALGEAVGGLFLDAGAVGEMVAMLIMQQAEDAETIRSLTERIEKLEEKNGGNNA